MPATTTSTPTAVATKRDVEDVVQEENKKQRGQQLVRQRDAETENANLGVTKVRLQGVAGHGRGRSTCACHGGHGTND